MKHRIFGWLLAMLILFSLSTAETFACTTFCLRDGERVVFGKNYDWMIGDGMLFVNKRGAAKTAQVEGKPARWISQFGSVTFNQYGREFPSGGINEAGLVIELMWLDDTIYPAPGDSETIGVLDWIQFQLDNYNSVEEVVANADKLRIKSEVKLHYLASDRSGRTATIEFLNGKFTPHFDEKLPVPALTNDTYQKSLEAWKKHSANEQMPAGVGSLERFVRAGKMIESFKAEKQKRPALSPVDYGFEVLANVAQPGATQWSIIYDLTNMQVHFRTMQNQKIKTFRVNSFDFSCASPVKMLDINADLSGDVGAKFSDYQTAANLDLLKRSFSGTPFLKNVPAAQISEMAKFPSELACDGKKPATEKAASQKSGLIGWLYNSIANLFA